MSNSEMVSYVVVAGTGVYCIATSMWSRHPLDFVAYGVVVIQASIGLLEARENNRLRSLEQDTPRRDTNREQGTPRSDKNQEQTTPRSDNNEEQGTPRSDSNQEQVTRRRDNNQNSNYSSMNKVWTDVEYALFYSCLVGRLWYIYGASLPIVYIHPCSMVVLYIPTMVSEVDKRKMLVAGYTFNALSCIYLSAVRENWFSLAATLVFVAVVGNNLATDDYRPLPKIETYNYGRCIVMLLSAFALELIC